MLRKRFLADDNRRVDLVGIVITLLVAALLAHALSSPTPRLRPAEQSGDPVASSGPTAKQRTSTTAEDLEWQRQERRGGDYASTQDWSHFQAQMKIRD